MNSFKGIRRGQLFILDSIVAGILIVLTIILLLPMHDHLQRTSAREDVRQDIYRRVLATSSILVETPGWPMNWSQLPVDEITSSSVSSIGLATTSPIEIDHEKISKLKLLLEYDNATAHELTGFLGPGYAFALRLYPTGNESFSPIYSIGPDAPGDTITTSRVLRFGIYNDTRTTIVFLGWTP